MHKNIFQEDSDEEDIDQMRKGKLDYMTLRLQESQKHQNDKLTQKLLQQNPGIYQYDEIKVENINHTKKNQQKNDYQPQYITQIKKALKVREIESTIAIEKVADKQISRDENPQTIRIITDSYKEMMKQNQSFMKSQNSLSIYDQENNAISNKSMKGFHSMVIKDSRAYQQEITLEQENEKQEQQKQQVPIELKKNDQLKDVIDIFIQKKKEQMVEEKLKKIKEEQEKLKNNPEIEQKQREEKLIEAKRKMQERRKINQTQTNQYIV